MYWNRYDIIMAYYCYFNDHNDGQFSNNYSRLSKMLGYYKPSRLDKGYDSLSENAKCIYDNLVANHD